MYFKIHSFIIVIMYNISNCDVLTLTKLSIVSGIQICNCQQKNSKLLRRMVNFRNIFENLECLLCNYAKQLENIFESKFGMLTLFLIQNELERRNLTYLKMAIEKCGKITQKHSLKRNPCKQNAYIGHERVKCHCPCWPQIIFTLEYCLMVQ